MNTKEQSAKMAEIFGCLKSQRTTTCRRRHEEDEDLLIPGIDPFLIDAEFKIAQPKAVRRMLDKTQVLTNPNNLHIRKRITHSGEVTAVASLATAVLGLNTELAKAIALGHDMGHAPFGHDGEAFLTKVSGKKFLHEIMGIVISQHIERYGRGLNLTHEVLSGFLRDLNNLSPEATIVMHADRIAYVTGDYNDIARIRYPVPDELVAIMGSLGANQRERVATLISALCLESAETGKVAFEKSEEAQKFHRTKDLMYSMYKTLNASNAESILERIHSFVVKVVPDVDPALLVALMTDHDAVFLASQPILDYDRFRQITVSELVPFLRKKEIQWWEPDLDW